jgi:hypothetical protein
MAPTAVLALLNFGYASQCSLVARMAPTRLAILLGHATMSQCSLVARMAPTTEVLGVTTTVKCRSALS